MKNSADGRHPTFWETLKEDVRVYSSFRGEPRKIDTWRAVLKGALELSRDTDAFLGLALYRARTSLLRRDVPVLPQLIHRVCVTCFQMDIGSAVVLGAGAYIPHGQILLSGNVRLGSGVILSPWITIEQAKGDAVGPTLSDYVAVGSGAHVTGAIQVGPRARIGANAVVTEDVPATATALGVPARIRFRKPKLQGHDELLKAAVRAKWKREGRPPQRRDQRESSPAGPPKK